MWLLANTRVVKLHSLITRSTTVFTSIAPSFPERGVQNSPPYWSCNDEMMSPRAAIRWSLQGVSMKATVMPFGKPTGKTFTSWESSWSLDPGAYAENLLTLDESAVWNRFSSKSVNYIRKYYVEQQLDRKFHRTYFNAHHPNGRAAQEMLNADVKWCRSSD
ncbi:hypothetical protein OH492_17135 [Vibrio chagasii]|nr:hypothetical protein [Vibrio chagasii]